MVTKASKSGSKVRSGSRSSSNRKVRGAAKKQPKTKARRKLSAAASELRRLPSPGVADTVMADQPDRVKIGILITYPRLEVKKEELISHRDKNRPWTKLADPKFVVERQFRRERKVVTRHPLGKYAIPTDVSVGCFIKYAYDDQNVDVDMILPHEISKERLAQNDINFLMIYDVLEAFHTDKTKDRRIYKQVKSCLETCDNIFPPLSYQKLINSKIEYYNYLNEKKIAIAPTLTLTKEQYAELGLENSIKKIVETAEEGKWDSFICKPVLGIEGIDTKFFYTDEMEKYPAEKKILVKYLERCMKKYPGLVIQKEIKDFGCSKKCPELRMYYVGTDYQYSVSANKFSVVRPVQEGGSLDTPLDALKNHTRKILRKLPPVVMPNGKRLPKLLTRLDMGYIVDGKYSPFVNEVEYVPSLYSEDCAHHPDRLIDAALGHQMVKIAKLYVK